MLRGKMLYVRGMCLKLVGEGFFEAKQPKLRLQEREGQPGEDVERIG